MTFQPGKIILVGNTDWYLYNFRLSLARFLKERGNEVLMVSPPGDFVEKLEAAGFRWLPWHVGRSTINPIYEFKSLLDLIDLYRTEKPRLVHHFTVKPVLYGSLASKLAGIDAIVNSITGLGYLFLQSGWKARLLRRFAKGLYWLVLHRPGTIAIFENANDRQFFLDERLTTAAQSRVIEGVGVDTHVYCPTSEPAGIPLVILPARMLWDKGVGVLVEAARLLKGRCALRIALVGNLDPGNPTAIDEKTIRQWIDEGLLEWWGFQDRMEKVYQACNIVTLPSMGEGLSTSLIEAAACARPIVTTDVQGCRDVVIDGINGFLVPPNDPKALADALERLANDADLRTRMGAAGRQIVLDRFTSDRVNEAILDVYQNLLPVR